MEVRWVEVDCWSENPRSNHVVKIGEVQSLAGNRGNGPGGQDRNHAVNSNGDVEVREMELLNPWRSHGGESCLGAAFVDDRYIVLTCKDDWSRPSVREYIKVMFGEKPLGSGTIHELQLSGSVFDFYILELVTLRFICQPFCIFARGIYFLTMNIKIIF